MIPGTRVCLKATCLYRVLERHGDAVLTVLEGNSRAFPPGWPQADHCCSRQYVTALVKYLDGISDAEIPELEIPTGIPLVYELDESLRPLGRYYLGNSAVVAQAQEALDRVVRVSGN